MTEEGVGKGCRPERDENVADPPGRQEGKRRDGNHVWNSARGT